MKYVLMHKNIAVALLDLDEGTGFIKKINELYEEKHLPYGVKVKNGIADRTALNDWWVDRSIPASRSGIVRALEVLNLPSTRMLLLRCFGLSLSDQYWIKPYGSDLEWSKLNFFENGFSEDVGDVLLGKAEKEGHFDFSSPDNTSDGYLKKRWKIVDGKRCLIKGGSGTERQQPFNEVIATEIMSRLNIPHVPYALVWDNNEPYSVCEDFVTADTELVSAWRILQTQQKSNNISVYQHLLNCCEAAGIFDAVKSFDRMIVLDFIIANEDRHLNNFGFLRNAETLEWLGAAPIFDSGSSLGYDKLASEIKPFDGIECKPFKSKHEAQLKLVSDFSWLDLNKLSDVEDIIRSVVSDERATERIGEKRIEAIIHAVKVRISYLGDFIDKHQKTVVDTTEGDVEANVAETYVKNKKL